MARSRQTSKDARAIRRRAEALAEDTPAPTDSAGSAEDQDAALRLAIDAMPHGFALFDSAERLVLCNAAYARHVWPGVEDILAPGVSFAEIVETAIRRRASLAPAGDPEAFRAAAFRGHRELPSASDIPFADGRWVRQSKSPTADGGVVATSINITEIKRNETASRATFERQAMLLETLPDGVVIQVQGRVVYANSAAARMRRARSGADLIGQSGLTYVHPDQRGPMLERIRKALAGRETLPPTEYTALLEDGTTYPVETRTTFIDWNGEPATLTVIRDLTERRRAEAEAAAIADQNRRLLETFPDGIVVHKDAVNTFVNPAAARLCGAGSPDEVVGRDIRDFIHPDAHRLVMDRVRSIMAERAAGRELPPIELTALRVDGSRLEVEARSTAVDWKGSPAILTVLRDLSERRRAEEALRETERRLSAVAANVPGAVYQRVLHPDGRLAFPYISEGVLETHGVSAAEVMADAGRYLSRVHPDDQASLLAQIRESARTLAPHDIALRIIRPDGRLRWLRSLARPHRRDDGAIVWDGVFVDITEQKRVEAALRETERRHSAITASIPGAVYERVLHPDGTVTFPYISEGVLKTHGVAAAEIMRDGDKLMDLLPPDDRRAMIERLRESARTLSPLDVEVRNARPDGTVVWVRSLAQPYRRADGAVVWDGIFIDITERKLVEEESRRAKESAELANRSKSQFLATVSHELRTPLNAIIGFSEILKQEMMGPLGNDSYRAYTQDIYDSGKHLLQVINDILDLAKIEAGKLDLHLADVDVRGAVLSSLRVVKGRAEEERIALATRLAEPLPRVRADERLVKQILMNLLSNAVKFTRAGGKVRIAARRHGRDRIRISVTDNGIGIAKADLERVLAPFGQVDSTLSREYEGTGLGLPLTKFLAELHGGALTLRSKPGRGTTVAVYLPLAG